MRRLLVLALVCLTAGASTALAALADPFGAPEVSDPAFRPIDGVSPVLGADATGNAYWLSFVRDANGGTQAAVYQRCAGAPWQPTLLGSRVTTDLWPVGLRVAANGTTMAVWSVVSGQSTTLYSSVRPAGGSWGAPQTIPAEADVTSVQFALSDSGAAVTTWTDSSPAGTWASIRPASGSWGTPEKVVDTTRDHAVAMSATGDAIVLFRQSAPGVISSSYRPATGPGAGTWGPTQEVLKNAYPDTLKSLMVEFDGLGRAVAIANFREFVDTVRVNVRSTAGAWGATDQVLDSNASFDQRGLEALARHKDGAVAAWTRKPTASNPNSELVISRLGAGGWETPHAFAVKPVGDGAVATNTDGEILVSGTVFGTFSEVWAAVVPSLSAAWPANLARVSPAGTSAADYRGEGIAASAGTGFYLGWGVHRGSNQRSEVISARSAVTCGAATPTPTPTATPSPTATAAPSPDPLPATPTPTPAATATPPPPAPVVRGPSAIADFTTLPAASKCVRGRKLTLRLKKPPKGYVVKTVTVKVNGKRKATIKGKQLKKPVYLRKLPTGTFTVEVSIKLKKGKGLTERRRYTACK